MSGDDQSTNVVFFFVKSSLKPLDAFAVLTIDSIKRNTAVAQEYSENACVVVHDGAMF